MLDYSKITQSALDLLREYMDDDLVKMLDGYGTWSPGDFLKAYLLEDPDFEQIMYELIGVK